MMDACEHVTDRLVDFADGELSAAESADFAGHIGRCSHCRERLDALRRSLDFARTVWEDAEEVMTDATPVVRADAERERSVVRRWRLVPLAVAAALLIAVGILQSPSRDRAPSPVRTGAAVTPADIEYEIARAALASQLLAAADLLAAQPGGEDYACERYRYIVAAYADSPAALESRSRLQSLCDERVEQ
jgi:anti-sigma factor RsiW